MNKQRELITDLIERLPLKAQGDTYRCIAELKNYLQEQDQKVGILALSYLVAEVTEQNQAIDKEKLN